MTDETALALIEAIDALRWDIRGLASLNDRGSVFSERDPRVDARECFTRSDAQMEKARAMLNDARAARA